MKKILIGNFKGPQGVQGRSAYQVAVNEGYVGSEAQWIESLHSIVPGPKGETGIQGYQGASITGLVFNADGSISVSIHDPKTNTDSTIAAGNALTSSLLAQMQQYVNNAGSSANAAAASQSAAKMSENNSALSAENASMSATASANSAASAAESAEAAKAISQGSVGFYTTSASLEAAHPIGKDGDWAIIGKTDTIWVWDGDSSIWKDTGEKTDLSNYYTKPQADAADAGIRGLTATVETSATASQAYAIGAYFVYNGLLYKCTVAIAQGKTITPGTNCTATTAGAEISTLNQNLAVSCKNNYFGFFPVGGTFRIQDISIPFNTTEQSADISFQIPFPHACFGVWLTPQSGYTNYHIGMSTANITKDGFRLMYSASSSFTIIVKMLAFGW